MNTNACNLLDDAKCGHMMDGGHASYVRTYVHIQMVLCMRVRFAYCMHLCVCVCVFVVSTILQPCSHASALKTYRHQENCATAMLCQSREVQPVLVICYYTHNHVRVFYRLSVTAFERINSLKAILDKMEKCVIAAG